MFGAVIGDIVGSRFEWNNIKTKEFSFFDYGCFTTDDSILTFAVAKSLLECSDDYSDLSYSTIKNLKEYTQKYPDKGYGGSFINWAISTDSKPYNSWGNGSAMRVSPCGIAAKSIEEAIMLSDIVTKVTHNHEEGIKGARATAVAVFLAKSGKSVSEIKEYICENYYDINFTLDEIRDSYIFDVSCQGSVPQALEAFFESTSFEDSIRNAISIGGDSDTIAAITGAVAEAYYGIPEEINTSSYKYIEDEFIAIYDIFKKKFK